jgi:hypothetical protein
LSSLHRPTSPVANGQSMLLTDCGPSQLLFVRSFDPAQNSQYSVLIEVISSLRVQRESTDEHAVTNSLVWLTNLCHSPDINVRLDQVSTEGEMNKERERERDDDDEWAEVVLRSHSNAH